MNIREAAIERGKELVWGAERARLQQKENAVPDKVYEIVGKTGADYRGCSTLHFFRYWEKRGGEGPKYYKFTGGKLTECTRRQAMATSLYRRNRILIYGHVIKVYDKGEMTDKYTEINLTLVKREKPDAC